MSKLRKFFSAHDRNFFMAKGRVQGTVSKCHVRWSSLCWWTHQIVWMQVMAVIPGITSRTARRAMPATSSILDLVVVVLEKRTIMFLSYIVWSPESFFFFFLSTNVSATWLFTGDEKIAISDFLGVSFQILSSIRCP